MKKVAFCLRGAISKDKAFLKENSLYSDKEYVDHIKCRNSIFKFIVSPNPKYNIDFFCHCWNIDLETKLREIYNPKYILVEDNNKYSEDIKKKCKTPTDFGGISQSLSMQKAINIKEQYEKQHNFKYDIVILYRYDVLLWKPIILDNYRLTDNNIFVNAHTRCNGDFHFIMKNNNSIIFKDLFNSILKGNNYKTHYWIKNFIVNFCKKEIIMDNIIPGKHQEVIRKINIFSIEKGYLSQEVYDNGFEYIDL